MIKVLQKRTEISKFGLCLKPIPFLSSILRRKMSKVWGLKWRERNLKVLLELQRIGRKGLRYQIIPSQIILLQIHAGVMRDTVFCPVYCIRAPSILFLQQYVIIYCFWGLRPNFHLFEGFSNIFGHFWRIFQYFWSFLKNFPIVLVNFGKLWYRFDKNPRHLYVWILTRDCVLKYTMGSLVYGNHSKSSWLNI